MTHVSLIWLYGIVEILNTISSVILFHYFCFMRYVLSIYPTLLTIDNYSIANIYIIVDVTCIVIVCITDIVCLSIKL